MNYTRGRTLTDKCLILDLDETLIKSFENSISLPIFNRTDPDYFRNSSRLYSFDHRQLSINGMSYSNAKIVGVMRPFLEEFIDFAFKYFRYVAVWSAGEDLYVKKICNIIFRHRKPYLIYSREKCMRDTYAKPLSLLMNDRILSSIFTMENTIIVDDKQQSIMHNTENGILIPVYDPPINSQYELYHDNDDALLKLMNWLLKSNVIKTTNVRNLDKSMIF